jgi:transporter family-2 protein
LTTSRPAITRLRHSRTRWWWWLGGLAGAFLVTSTADGVPQIGVALVTVCIVAGTAIGGLVVDEFGLGPGGRAGITRWRAAGAALAIAAVSLGAVGDNHAAVKPALFAALIGAGAASAAQQAANGQLRRTSASVAVASFVSFTAGTVLLVIVAAARGDLTGRSWPGTWWLYTGGALGAIYIAIAAAMVARLGVLIVSLATVAGQLAAAVVLDVAWPSPGVHLRPTTVIGAVLTLVAVAVSALRRPVTAPA